VPANLKFFILSDSPAFQGWRYFWAKNVRGFDPSVHYARCLIGSYEKKSAREPRSIRRLT
jgi:hypothetical protein